MTKIIRPRAKPVKARATPSEGSLAKGDTVIERVALADGKELVLSRWDQHIAISVGTRSLMSSHEHGSEDELGRVVGAHGRDVATPRVLIGGLGLGYTLRAALDVLPGTAQVVVAELVPAVVRWNREVYGELAGHPLDDPRVEVVVGDVAKLISPRRRFDVILLDVDNGPVALTHAPNAALYQRAGLARTHAALRTGGLLAVWSAHPSRAFTLGLRSVGFEVEVARAAPTMPGGPKNYIWLATRG